MPLLKTFAVATVIGAGALAALPASAASSSASSALDSLSTSVGQSSDSISRSSNSSGGNARLAQGDYRVVELVALAGEPGMLRLTLQALPGTGAEGEFALRLPEAAAVRGHVEAGATVTATAREYGLAFSNAVDAQAFFLVLDDAWFRELQARPVVL